MAFFGAEMAENQDDHADITDCEPSEGDSNGGGEMDEARDGVDDGGGREPPADATPLTD